MLCRSFNVLPGTSMLLRSMTFVKINQCVCREQEATSRRCLLIIAAVVGAINYLTQYGGHRSFQEKLLPFFPSIYHLKT